MRHLLDVENVAVRFPLRRSWWSRGDAAVHAVTDVSLHVDRGEVVGVVGESGSGKTTLGRAILGLQSATEGQVMFDGHVLARQTPNGMRQLRRRFQPVFQDPTASLNPSMTVAQTLAEALMLGGVGTRTDRAARVIALLDRVGLPPSAAARLPHSLSGGQRQRVGIARALAVEPELLVADEAVSALDVSVQAGIINLLTDLRRDLGLAILFVSHDLALVGHFCDRVIVLYLGRVMEAGPAAAIFRSPRHPYTRALLDAAPGLARDARQRPVLSGELPSPVTPPSGCVFRTRCPYVIPACAEQVPPWQLIGDAHGAACIRQDELARDQALAP